MEFELSTRKAGGGTVDRIADGWRLQMPSGSKQAYRLAQLDDYIYTPKRDLRHAPALTFSLRARVSSTGLPGTWGFGLWNDPFGLSLGFGGASRRLPALPQTTWFMHASPPNWLSLRNDPEKLPPNGFFAGTFRSSGIPTILLVPALIAVPLCAIHPIPRSIRKLASRIVRQDGVRVTVDITQWHEYSLAWHDKDCTFRVDGHEILSTPVSPRPPLGLVIWMDNQFAAWTPEGRFGYGLLANPAAWMEIENLTFP